MSNLTHPFGVLGLFSRGRPSPVEALLQLFGDPHGVLGADVDAVAAGGRLLVVAGRFLALAKCLLKEKRL